MLMQLLLSLLCLYVTRVVWRRWRYDLHRIPSPPALPIIGNTLDLFIGGATKKIWLYLRTNFDKHGYPPVIRVDSIWWTRLLVRDASFLKDVMNSKTKSFPREIDTSMPVIPIVGNDVTAKSLILTATPTPYVKAYRRIFGAAFSNSNLTAVMPKINHTMDVFLKTIERKRPNGSIDFQALCARMTLDTIGRLVFDLNLGGLDDSRPLLHLLEETSGIGMDNFYNPMLKTYCELLPWTSTGKKQKHAIDSINAEWDWIIEQVKKKDEPKDGTTPLWWLLKNLKDPETGMPPNHKSLRTEVAVTVIVGMDTTGHQLAWTLALLASHPHVKHALMKELKEHGLADENRTVTFQDLGELSYLTAVIKEGMRVAYVVPATFVRIVPEDMNILGYRVPKGTQVLAPGTRGINADADWGDADVFRPGRWLTGEDMSNKYFLGFSVGPRDCVGQRLAMLEMRLAIVRLLQCYSLELDDDITELMNNTIDSFVIKARNGIWLRVSPKNDKEIVDGVTVGCGDSDGVRYMNSEE